LSSLTMYDMLYDCIFWLYYDDILIICVTYQFYTLFIHKNINNLT
jgi:hypothetical protein